MTKARRIEFPDIRVSESEQVRKLLAEEKAAAHRKQQEVQDRHGMVRFQIGRGMSRSNAERIWGKEMVAEALDSRGMQTFMRARLVAAE